MTIKQIQHLLAYLGYYTLGVDGIWGDGSARACKAFQRDYNKTATEPIGVDGVPGKQTQEALRKAVGSGFTVPEDKTGDADALFWAGIKHFTPNEFACPCCGFDDVDHELVRICQRLRDHFDAPFQVSSGCRCPKHNAEVGGVATSKHQSGRAVDFCIRGRSAAQVLPVAQSMPGIRYAYAIDSSYVHMEMA